MYRERKSLRCQLQGGHNLLTRYRFDDICSEDCDIYFSANERIGSSGRRNSWQLSDVFMARL